MTTPVIAKLDIGTYCSSFVLLLMKFNQLQRPLLLLLGSSSLDYVLEKGRSILVLRFISLKNSVVDVKNSEIDLIL